jgi:hypothetical protein
MNFREGWNALEINNVFKKIAIFLFDFNRYILPISAAKDSNCDIVLLHRIIFIALSYLLQIIE